ncbi:MAG: hypothetical protein F6K40_02530 [Okeania sp. SIO3I5]|uniref:hypothetical protein n=1 Tax=Okeania sp. SIO3I5 TaxID=2607805 RepID=UPI0013B87D1C|nr:hypothetical protein [Okeania sp. SIO3I5]NEQ35242.1 hypothetical protein [Okeania sp. SIO3I5]
MAAAITTTSATLEGQAIEVNTALMLKQRETANADKTAIVQNVNFDYDTSQGQIALAFQFGVEIDATGNAVPKIIEIYDV